jgi:hypothetical protein
MKKTKNKKQSLKLKVFWIFVILAGASLLLGIPRTVTYEHYGIIETAEARSEDLLDSWINLLAQYECDGCGSHYRRVDSNHRYSYSCLQYQETTFREMVRLYDKGLPEEQIGILIYDCSYQKQLTRALIEDKGKKAARHWYTSVYVRGLGEPPVNH